MRYLGVLAGFLALGAGAQESQDKVLLRAKFKKGEKLAVKLDQKLVLTLEQIPDQFKEMLGNKPLDLKITGTVDVEVKEVADDGTAKLEGKFRVLNAKGNVFVNEVDYSYDSSKPQPRTDDGGEGDPGAFGMDPTAMLRQLSTQVITLKVTELGKVDVEGNFGQGGGGMAAQLFSLNGLVGTFPKEKVGAGDKWNSSDGMMIPGAQFKVTIKSENTVEKLDARKSGSVAVVKTKATVGTSESDSSDQGSMFNLKATMTGGGDGTTEFAVETGRPRKSESDLKIKITATMDDPQGGSALEFKATLERGQKIEIE